jgi:hypothetical protein
MRINLPVTQREYPFPADATLRSTTDLKGRITHCNADFIEVSRYSREGLRDLWATISSGNPPLRLPRQIQGASRSTRFHKSVVHLRKTLT